jgi:iron complex outermembrane receptor protein
LRRSTILQGVSALAVLLAAPALAQTSPPAQVAPVTVIAASPLPGAALDVAKAPYDVRTLTASDLQSAEPDSATHALTARLGGVSLNDNLDDPFQPDILYRGFEASPVLGTPQGLAVYQNGVRINEAFGDAVNWDLIPDSAIRRIDVVGTNPVYGLNALGGAIVVEMRDGFTDPGGEAEVSGGAFGRRSAAVSYGLRSDHLAGFVALNALDEDGWRRFSQNRVRQAYADLAARGDRWNIDLSYSGADNDLHGESATPVQELAVSRRLVFTTPQTNVDRLSFVTLKGGYEATDRLSFQVDLYWRGFRQSIANGNTTGAVACTDDGQAGQLCQSDGLTPLTGAGGQPIPDISQGGALPIGENDREQTRADTVGFALQANFTQPILGHGNQLVAGGSLDRARVDFSSSAELGVINGDLVVQPSGHFVVTPEGGAFTATPVSLKVDDLYAGLYFNDTFDVTSDVALSVSGRFNDARIRLNDQLGEALTGESRYRRFNPAVGMTWRPSKTWTLYAGYAEGNRAPTPSEIECSDPARPCLLPSSLSADPPTLKQVVSRTYEAGLRGARGFGEGRLTYSLSLFRTQVHDDIYGVATSLSAGYFQNIPGTRRQGGEADVAWRGERLTAYASLSYVQATFGSDLTLPSPSNPFADANGDIHVRRGDRLPGIPAARLKFGADGRVLKRLRLGVEVQMVGSEHYRGDEANQVSPVPGYTLVTLHGSYALSDRLELFGRIENALDARFSTFGLLGDPTGVGAPGVPETGADPRFQSPAAPFAVYGGIRVTL